MRTVLTVGTLLACLALAACSSAKSADTPEPAPSAAASIPSLVPSPPAGTAAPLSAVAITRAFPNLTFVRMTGMYELADGSNRFLVTEQRGTIMVFDNRPDVQQASLFMDIRGRVNTDGNEEGLLGVAFSPDFDKTGVFYVDYVARNPERTVIARFTANAGHTAADPSSEQRLLEINQPFPNHKGGQIAFGPDGYLYIGMGDGGSANDPGNRAQNLNEVLGKILRIDVSAAGDGLPYSIPADNPFAGRQGARGEVFSYGMRNPWRFSFDSETGALWVGDVGQNAFEEIDIVTKGANYGWPQIEATHCNAAKSATCDKTGTVPPIIEYPTASPNCSITGGFVYRAGRIPSLQGAYVYGDYCSGKVWALRYDGAKVTEQREIADTSIQISSFAIDRAGNIYALAHSDSGGGIFRIAGQ
jgi:glucose/arabinose dehydrogenase